MAIIFEGTFADLQAQLPSLTLPPERHIRLESQEIYLDAPASADEKRCYPKTIENIIAEQDEEEVRDASRIAGYQYPDRAA